MTSNKTKDEKLKKEKHNVTYSQRDWDRVVGVGKVPYEYEREWDTISPI
jgi:hypothetical protein